MKKFCNATNLKWFAIILMVFDHIHQMFYFMGAPIWLTYLGRPVFPILLFLAADSFYYTRDRKAYLRRLLFAGWIMTVSDYALQNILPNPEVVLMNNAFSTFFVAALYMLFWERFAEGVREKNPGKIVSAVFLCFVPILMSVPLFIVVQLSFNPAIPGGVIRFLAMLSLLFPNIMTAEGGFAMVALGAAFYIFRKRRWAQVLVLVAFSALDYVVSGGFQWLMVFAVIPILLYNGEKGRGQKWFFYIFYPTHIWILYVLSTMIR